MNKDSVTSKQLIYLFILFIFGSSLVVGADTKLGQDSWLSMLAAMVLIIPVILMYARISSLNPDKDLFDIMQDVYKPVIGKMFIILMIIYALLLGAVVTNEMAAFTKLVALNNTPLTAISLAFILVIIYLGLSGIKTLAKGAIAGFYLTIVVLIFTFIMSAGRMHINHLMPIAEHSIGQILQRGYKIVNIPLAETVLFLAFADYWRRDKKNNPYKTYFWGIFIASFLLLAIVLRNILVLGAMLEKYSTFPSYQETRLVGIKNFLERIEAVVTFNLIIASVAKVGVCLIAAAKGTAKLFGTKDYRYFIVPLGFLILAMSLIVISNSAETGSFLETGMFWMIPFLFVIPLIVWIGSEIKTRIKKRKEKNIESMPEP